ncbi:hypothetical protein BDQ17DRAFT_1234944, partial [Cyathus striatus]
ITEGSYCTAQGVLKQMGDVGVALTSLAIAFQTFFMLVLQVNAPTFVNKIVIALIWLFITLVIGINSRNRKYYGNTDYWCWIGPEYKIERIVFEYLWMWIAGGIMLILYGIIFLVMRGILDFNGGIKFHLKGRVTAVSEYNQEKDRKKNIANLMLFYPAVYIFCVLPVGIVRWLDFSGHTISPAATIFASVVFSLSGLFNVTLYYHTRPQLITGPRIPIPHKHGHPYSIREGVRYKLGHLPDNDDDFPNEEVGRGYLSRTSPSLLSHANTRLPDIEYNTTQGHLPSLDVPLPGAGYVHYRSEYTPTSGRLPSTEGKSLWSNMLDPHPGSRDTTTSGVSPTAKEYLGRLPDL